MDVGAELRTAREGKKLSIDTVAQRTRIPHRALAAIERNDLGAIPPRPFGRGFVRAYAAEVGLNGDQLAREYFAQFPPVEPPREAERVTNPDPNAPFELPSLSSQWAGLISAGVLLFLVIASAVFIGRRQESRNEPNAVGTVGAAQTAPAKDDAKGVAPIVGRTTPAGTTPGPQASAQTTPLKLDFSVTRPCWVAANADGQQTLYRIVQPGENLTVTASHEIAIRFGDAGAVAWTLNGRKGENLGAQELVRDLRITPENAASIR
jgi:cytoskeleton protein RodZ